MERFAGGGRVAADLSKFGEADVSAIHAKSLKDLQAALLITEEDDPAWDEGEA
jgi:hypothetical protein